MEVELNHDDVATQLVYLVAGIEFEASKHRVTQRLLGNKAYAHPIMASGGHTGMVADLLPYAKLVSEHITSMQAQDFPGVFEYEVTESLGMWLAKTAEEQGPLIFPLTARPSQFKKQLALESKKFFDRGNR